MSSVEGPASRVDLPSLGVGITHSWAIEPIFDRQPSLIDFIEVEPQTTWIETGGSGHGYSVRQAVLEHLIQLPGGKLVHSIGTPVGGSVRPQSAQLELLRHTIVALGAPWASDHLSFNTTPEFKTGFFLPPRQSEQGVATAQLAIEDLQRALPVPFAIETGVSYLKPRPDELPDGAFVASVAARASCGILLDLHNIYTNALNGRQSIDDYLAQIPLDRIWEIHVAGGFELEGYWLDAHSGAIPDALYEMAAWVIPQLPNLKAMVFEIYPSFVEVVGLELVERQLERLHELWALRTAPVSEERQIVSIPYRISEAKEETPSVADWEVTLGALVIGRSVQNPLSSELDADNGIRVVRHLIKQFRASMLVNTLRLTLRFLMLALNPAAAQAVLEDFWSKIPPQQYASTEAICFATYLEQLDLKVPQLAKVLEFERAVLVTLLDDEPRVIKFDYNPVPLLRALAEGHLPSSLGQAGDFEIEVTPDTAMTVNGANLNVFAETVAFH